MLWIYCGLFLSLVGAPGPASTVSLSKREADYTLDDSYWNEESPVGEVERLLREYRQNQDMVRGIGTHFYQIIYPVQLRHHEKMGISTREVGAPKFPQRGYGDGGNYPNTARGRNRTGKHFHRTSLLIKAFNHKFRLDLELNTQLLAPNLVQKHFLPSGAEQVSKQEIEHCYYHGTVKDYPGATAAFHTCNGVSGVIHVGNETFVIHPFYGGDLSKHPHVIFEARTNTNKGCANAGNLEWRVPNYRRQKHIPGTADGTGTKPSGARYRRSIPIGPKFRWSYRKGAGVRMGIKEGSRSLRDRVEYVRYRRDVREAIKYIETAIVIDKAMFEKRNGSSRMDVVHDAIQVANIADLYFRTLNTRVSVVYIETWQGTNQAPIDKSEDISRALLNFNDYTSRKLFKVDKDTTQLLTGETSFQGGKSGMAVPETVCTARSVGISVDINAYEPHLLAGTMAHMIGHNIGMGHDDGREECHCKDWHGCIMAQSIVGLENVQPYKFSECSRSDYTDALRIGHGICLLNKPNEVLPVRRTCGNSIVEEGEDCDCGTIDECPELDPCCDPITCKLTSEAECASGPCCNNCRLLARGVICRDAVNECDLPEHCSGEDGKCPMDIYKKNGNPCGGDSGYCFSGICPTVNNQCVIIWGYGGIAGDKQCFDQFNSKGSINGHCGVDSNGQYVKCDPENVRCGSLQCQMGNRSPVNGGKEQLYATTIISIKGQEYECKATNGIIDASGNPDMGLVRDGTPCGDNLICVNQSCTSIFPYIDQGKCPSNHNNLECSGHGVCSNVNKCYCDMGWSGPDCSMQIEVTLPPQHTTTNSASTTRPPKMEKKETPYDVNSNKLGTITMVVILVVVVTCVFSCFTLMAVCYRKSTMPKYDPPYVKKPMVKKYAGKGANHNPEEAAMENVNKILTFGSMPSYSRGDSQRVLYRPVNHMTAGSITTRFQEHKLQQLKRLGVGPGSEEGVAHSGEEDAVSFIDLPSNNLSKLPEKGILKKSGPYGTVVADVCKEKWSEDSQSDNQEILSQSDNNMGPDMMGGGAISSVERTLKSLNGYHEDILEALRNAASHRGAATPSGSSSLLSEEILRKSLADCSSSGSYSDYKRSGSQEKVCDGPQTHTVLVEGTGAVLHHHGAQQEEDEDNEVPPSCGPIRIRNLEDLIRQLEHHSARHMSPSGSEDIRTSETEADRHYRHESAACEPQSRCRGREEEPRFVLGRYRHPTGRHPPGYHQHHLQEEEGIYETADHDRGVDQLCGDTPDSGSDEFIQAQQLVRSASEEALPVTAKPSSSTYERHHTRHHSHHKASPHQQDKPSMAATSGGGAVKREYYPSPPPPESEDESSPDSPSPTPSAAPAMISAAGSQSTEPLRRLGSEDSVDEDNDSSRETVASSSISGTEQTALLHPKRYPEYKH